MIAALLLLAVTPQWSVEVGEGYSPPVVVDQTVCSLSRKGDDEQAACFDRVTGKKLWQDIYRVPFKKNSAAMKMAAGPFSTPVIAGGTLFTLGVAANLRAYDVKTGRLKWGRAPATPVKTSSLFCGTAMTPLFDQGRLVVFWGDDSGGELFAVDPANGKTIWSNKGESPAYASLAIGVFEGVRQYIGLGEAAAFGVDAATGKTLWRVPWADEWKENIVTPIIANGVVILSGVRKPTTGIHVSKDGDVWEAKTVWTNAQVPMYMSDPVLDGTALFGFSSREKGRLFALDTTTGKTLWTSEARYAEQARLTLTGTGASKTLYVMASSGELIAVEPSSGKLREIARQEMSKSAVYARPAFAGKAVYIKDEAHLSAFALP